MKNLSISGYNAKIIKNRKLNNTTLIFIFSGLLLVKKDENKYVK